MHHLFVKSSPLTATLANTLAALRNTGSEITAASLARQMGLNRGAVFERFCRLEQMGLITSRRVKGGEGYWSQVFRVCKEGEIAMKQEWEYDPLTRVITTGDAVGKRWLIASQIKPREARIVFGLIGIARKVVASGLNPNPFGCKADCKCVACEARRLLDAIGGDA